MIPKLPTTINALWGDGAYDSTPVYKALYNQHIKPVFPLRRGANLTEKIIVENITLVEKHLYKAPQLYSLVMLL